MSLQYLQDGFDPESLKVAELRRILTENGIEFPSNSKKKNLLQLYKQSVLPMIPGLRAEHIINSEDKDIEENNDYKSDASERAIDRSSKKKRKRKSKGDDNNDDDDEHEQDKADQSVKNEPRRFSTTSISSSGSSSSLDIDMLQRVKKSYNLSTNNDSETSTPQKKKRRTQNEEVSPILQKISSKSPSKTNNESLSITNFNITSDEDDENEKDSLNDNSDSNTPNKEIFDFSYKRRTLSPDLNKLNVSPAFSQQLKEKMNENEDIYESQKDMPVVNSSQNIHRNRDNITKPQDYGFYNLPEFKNVKSESDLSDVKQPTLLSSKKSSNNINEDVIEILDSSSENEGENDGNSTSNDNENDYNNYTGVTSRIKTPELPSEKDIQDSNERVQKLQTELTSDWATSNRVRGLPEDELQEDELHRNEISEEISENDENQEDISSGTDKILDQEEKQSSKTSISPSQNNAEGTQNDIDNFEETGSDIIAKDSKKAEAKIANKQISIVRRFLKLLLKFMLWGFGGIIILFAMWYREEKFSIGYCGHEVVQPTLFEQYPQYRFTKDIDRFLDNCKPECISCPTNAICYPYLKIRCKPEYKLEKSKFGLFGILPVSDKCVKDDKRNELINEIVLKSLEFLRLKNAQIECGENSNDIESGISEHDLFQIFNESKDSSMLDDEYFIDIWSQVVDRLGDQPDIVYRQVSTIEYFTKSNNKIIFTNKIEQLFDSEHKPSSHSNYEIRSDDFQGEEKYLQKENRKEGNGHFRSSSKKYISVRCRFEQEIYRTYHRYRHIIWIVLIITVFLKYIQFKLKLYYREKMKITELAEEVVQKLKNNKILDNTRPYLSIVQLRDTLMSNEVNLKKRNNIWNKVSKKVEKNNTNIKSSLVEVQGDIMKCWEWIGPIYNKEIISDADINDSNGEKK